MKTNLDKAKRVETDELLKRFKSFLTYDPSSGNLCFKDTRHGAVEIGQVAGNLDCGYIRIHHRGRLYMAHRIAWALYHGRWPEHTIDHINRDGTDNRISNLRDIPQAENNKNKSRYKKRVDPRSGNW